MMMEMNVGLGIDALSFAFFSTHCVKCNIGLIILDLHTSDHFLLSRLDEAVFPSLGHLLRTTVYA